LCLSQNRARRRARARVRGVAASAAAQAVQKPRPFVFVVKQRRDTHFALCPAKNRRRERRAFCSIPSAAGGRGEDFLRYRAGSHRPGAGELCAILLRRKCRFWRKTGAQNYTPNCSGKRPPSQGKFRRLCLINAFVLCVLRGRVVVCDRRAVWRVIWAIFRSKNAPA